MKIKILSLIFIVGSLCSCGKWLNVELANTVDEHKLFSTSQGFTDALAGVYSQMSKSGMYGKALTMEYLDVYARIAVGQKYSSHASYDYKNSGVESVQLSIWTKMYESITGVNNILRWSDIQSEMLGETRKNQIKGEAIALRAFLHFDLIRMFCPDVKHAPKSKGIPYNKVFGVSLAPQYTVEECVQLVLNDLNEAETLLAGDNIKLVKPYEFKSKNESDMYVARMNLYAVKAMKARLYLMRGDLSEAAKYAQEVIDSDKFRLLEFSSTDKDESSADVLFSDEHIFSLRNKDVYELSKNLFFKNSSSDATDTAPLSISDAPGIYESNNEDVRYEKWFQLGGRNVYSKYTKENSDAFFGKVPLIRLSEMYLILAEIHFATDVYKSLSYINTLRDHRIRNNKHWQYLTRESIFDEIKREFISEGQIWFTYKRLNKAIPANSPLEPNVEPTDAVFVFPIPRKEIEIGNR